MDQVYECPAQCGGRGVGASQKQVNHHLDQVLLIERGDGVIHGLVGLEKEQPWHLSKVCCVPILIGPELLEGGTPWTV